MALMFTPRHQKNRGRAVAIELILTRHKFRPPIWAALSAQSPSSTRRRPHVVRLSSGRVCTATVFPDSHPAHCSKKGETRTVLMTPEVYRVFTQLWQERRLDTQRVFLYKEKPVRVVKKAFDKACRRAGIRNLRLHDLRHTASTNLRRAGVDATTAMKIVGHKSERMHRRYNTVEPEDPRRAVSQQATYQANTLTTPGPVASDASDTDRVSAYLSSARP